MEESQRLERKPLATQQGLYDTLLGLVSVYSPTGRERPAVEWLVARMESLGFSQAYTDQAGNAVGVMGNGPRTVVLLGHIDTVPGEIPVRMEGDILHGRGTVDAKGALAAFVDAVAGVGPVEGWQFIILGCVDEEGDSRGARHALPHYSPQIAIVGEPSRWDRVTLGYKGHARATITLRQKQNHTSRGEERACESLVQTWMKIRDWVDGLNEGRSRVFDQVQVVLRRLASGEEDFEEWASMVVSSRLPMDIPPEDWLREIARLFPQATVETDGYAIPAFLAEKNTALVRAFLKAIRGLNGSPGFVLKSGTADMNLVAPVWKCPVVAYGPGDSTFDHTPEEQINLGEYIHSVRVLRSVLSSLTVTDSAP
jgi:[amino group carrier protein]-lysine/ornithine hydrolase